MDKSRLKSTVFVANLDLNVTQETLHAAFIPFGTIADISLPKPELVSNRDPHRGFGYVEFEDVEDAREAIDNMDQSELFGRVIKVAQAREKRGDGPEGLGSKTAVWEQEGYLAKHGAGEEAAAPEIHDGPADPMQGLEGLDVAGPKPA